MIHHKGCHHEDGRKCGSKIFHIIGFTIVGILFAVIFALLFGFAVQLLWNWVIPSIFGLPPISYLQAFIILLLAKILFGSFGGHHKHHKSHPWERKYKMEFRKEDSPFNSKDFKRYWDTEGKEAFDNYLKETDDLDKK